MDSLTAAIPSIIAFVVLIMFIIMYVQLQKLRINRSTLNYENRLDLEKIIQSVTDDIVRSQKRIKDGSGNSMFFVNRAEISISFVVKQSAGGKAQLFAAEVDQNYGTENVNQITLELTTTPPMLEKVIEKMQTSDALDTVLKFTQTAGE